MCGTFRNDIVSFCVFNVVCRSLQKMLWIILSAKPYCVASLKHTSKEAAESEARNEGESSIFEGLSKQVLWDNVNAEKKHPGEWQKCFTIHCYSDCDIESVTLDHPIEIDWQSFQIGQWIFQDYLQSLSIADKFCHTLGCLSQLRTKTLDMVVPKFVSLVQKWQYTCHRLHGGLEHIATGAASDNQTQSCHFQ